MLSILLKNQKISFIFQSSDTIINMSAQIILFLLGGLQIIEGSLSIGVFTIISAYFNNIVKATKYFINLGNEYVDTTISAKRIKELLDIPEQNNGNMRINNINTISLQNVSFGYTAKQIINEFNYTFKQNNIYIIKGKNGKGKSTLLNLMLGLHVEEYCGKILINNVDINHIDLINLRKLISFIPQNDFIIEGTVIDNITLDIQKDEMYERSIMKLCNQFCFSTSKYNHYIHENKNTFSGGEIKKSA
jgi:ATP-binding cassette subfamily C protein